MKSTKAASRYAKALLELAIDQKKIDSILGDMVFLLEVSSESKDFELLVNSPLVKSDKKIEIFELIFEQFEKESMDFIKLITNNRRESMLPAIATSFDMLVKDHRGIVPVTIITASKMDSETRDALLTKIKSSVKGELELTERIDESLIGGFLVEMGDIQIDATVLNQFNNLKQRLTR
jgi:F-type H+-transporting ATPase subunit delta